LIECEGGGKEIGGLRFGKYEVGFEWSKTEAARREPDVDLMDCVLE